MWKFGFSALEGKNEEEEEEEMTSSHILIPSSIIATYHYYFSGRYLRPAQRTRRFVGFSGAGL